LRMAQMRGKLGRMPKKQRDEKVEKMKSDMEQQQKAFMEQIKLLTPEQRKAMGIPDIATNEAKPVEQVPPENQQPVVRETTPMDIPIQLPRMTPVKSNDYTLINTQNTTQI
jgi:hypothetical protein